mmetsp:Transcript_41025/g.92350  ORF Transcript_41025/g.92350 Transcript_41025/m.92350 type:complete len:478 (+) Transcript_41025:139-1572(+)
MMTASIASLLLISIIPRLSSSSSDSFSGPQKFASFDSTRIKSMVNAHVVFGPVSKHPKPLLVADKPWELTPTSRMDNGYPNIIYDPSDQTHPPFRMWYDCCVKVGKPNKCSPGSDIVGLLYAESQDGFAWTKPSLGVVDFQGSADNNIVLLGTHGLGVFRDENPAEPSARRFKAMGMHRPDVALKVLQPGTKLKKTKQVGSMFTSADGINWDLGPQIDVGENRWDTHQNMFWERGGGGRYVGFTRGKTDLAEGGMNRTVARFVGSNWGGPWSAARVVHAGSGAHDQLYEQIVFPYYSGYLGLVVSYDNNFVKGSAADRTRCELAWSPDSVRWRRLRDERGRGTNELIPLGGGGGGGGGGQGGRVRLLSGQQADPSGGGSALVLHGGQRPPFRRPKHHAAPRLGPPRRLRGRRRARGPELGGRGEGRAHHRAAALQRRAPRGDRRRVGRPRGSTRGRHPGPLKGAHKRRHKRQQRRHP